jgi:hypothetical protein
MADRDLAELFLELTLTLAEYRQAHPTGPPGVTWKDIREGEAGKLLVTFECLDPLAALDLVGQFLMVRRKTEGD